MNNCNCEICNGKGWIESSVFDSSRIADGTVVIEKCKECNYFINDTTAAKFAFQREKINSFLCDGFNVKIDFHLN